MRAFGLILATAVWLTQTGETGADDRDMAVIELHHRIAEEVVDLVKPLLDPGEVIIPNRTSVIVKASSSRLAEVNALIQELDRPQRRLMITVAQGSGLSSEALDESLSVRGGSDATTPGDGSSAAFHHSYRTESFGQGNQVLRIQAMDGQAAQISFGNQIPVPQGGVVLSSPMYGGALVNPGIAYRDLGSGFSVTARLSGDQVFLDISPWSEQLDRRGGGVIDTQSATTSLHTKLGEWVELAGELSLRDSDRGGGFSHRYQTRSAERRIFLRVDDLERQ